MSATQSAYTPDMAPPSRGELLDKDVLSFVYRQPHLTEFAFLCADHGVIHVGALVQLSERQALAIAEGDKRLLAEVKDRLGWSGLSFGMDVGAWTDPDAPADEVEH